VLAYSPRRLVPHSPPPWPGAERTGEPVLTQGFVKAGVVVDDFDGTLAMLRSKGVSMAFGPFLARAGQRANVIVRDLEGNLIQFFGR
jgi:hypothetical protein